MVEFPAVGSSNLGRLIKTPAGRGLFRGVESESLFTIFAGGPVGCVGAKARLTWRTNMGVSSALEFFFLRCLGVSKDFLDFSMVRFLSTFSRTAARCS